MDSESSDERRNGQTDSEGERKDKAMGSNNRTIDSKGSDAGRNDKAMLLRNSKFGSEGSDKGMMKKPMGLMVNGECSCLRKHKIQHMKNKVQQKKQKVKLLKEKRKQKFCNHAGDKPHKGLGPKVEDSGRPHEGLGTDHPNKSSDLHQDSPNMNKSMLKKKN